jgi:hypothetical protein
LTLSDGLHVHFALQLFPVASWYAVVFYINSLIFVPRSTQFVLLLRAIPLNEVALLFFLWYSIFPASKKHGIPHHSSHLSAETFEISLPDCGLGREAIPTLGISTAAELLPALGIGNDWSPSDKTFPACQPLQKSKLTNEPFPACQRLQKGVLTTHETFPLCQPLQKGGVTNEIPLVCGPLQKGGVTNKTSFPAPCRPFQQSEVTIEPPPACWPLQKGRVTNITSYLPSSSNHANKTAFSACWPLQQGEVII